LDIDEDLRLPRLKVDLGSIELDREIVIQFGINNFTNHKTFSTDSNGLEMQQRIENYQKTYPLDAEDLANDNVTLNYYPINSAISMKDADSARVFTVINDHT